MSSIIEVLSFSKVMIIWKLKGGIILLLKTKTKILVAILFVTMLTFPKFVLAHYTNANAFFFSYPPVSTVSAIPHWSDSSVSTLGFSTYFSNARARWDEVQGASIGWSQRTNSADASFRFYGINDSALDYAGITKPFNTAGTHLANPDQHAGPVWYKVHIILNKEYMDDRRYDTDNIQKVAIHEVGHALGLRHQPNDEGPLDTVMIQGRLWFTNTGSIDRTNVSWKY